MWQYFKSKHACKRVYKLKKKPSFKCDRSKGKLEVEAIENVCESEAYSSFHHEDLSRITSLWANDLNLSMWLSIITTQKQLLILHNPIL
jgi:hypothetical protein